MRESEPEPQDVDDTALHAFYTACEAARLPKLPGIVAAAWWRALVVAAYFLAARRGTLLSIRWDQVDLAAATLRYDGLQDKARRARTKPLHPLLVQHLLAIRREEGLVFAWPHARNSYYHELRRVQSLAGVRWKLHDLKRTAATRGSEVLTPFELKQLCDHSSIRTTERFYVRSREQTLRASIAKLPIPEAFRPRQLQLFDRVS